MATEQTNRLAVKCTILNFYFSIYI